MKTLRIAAFAVLVVVAAVAGSGHARAEDPRTIAIHARRFEFEPREVHLAKGESVVLELTSEDVKHGFFSRAFHFDEDVEPGKTTRVPVTASQAGSFTVICDRYCGSGHGNMKMTIVVD